MTQLTQFAGNRRTVGALQTMLEQHRVPQTMIFEGPVGSGRRTLARLLAAGLLCEQSRPPCGSCDACRKVLGGIHPDVTAVEPLSGKAAIGVDQIRQVRNEAFVLPGEGRCKVFILRGALNDAAQNAFLKILEEPPAGVYYILLCVHRNELMDTVLSRAVTFSLGSVSFEEAVPVLEAAGLPLDENTRARFAESGGILGNLLSQDHRLSAAGDIAAAAARAIAQDSREAFLRAVAPAVEDRNLYSPVLDGILRLLRDGLTVQLGRPPEDSPYTECTQLLARRLTRSRMLAVGQLITKEQTKLLFNPNGWLFFTALCAGLFPRER